MLLEDSNIAPVTEVSLEEDTQLPELSRSRPTPQDLLDIPTRAVCPRQLIVYYEDKNVWLPCTDEHQLAEMDYLAVSYRQTDFPDKTAFEESVRAVCDQLTIDAYWLDFACTGQSIREKSIDLYRVADIFRGSKVTLIMIKGDEKESRSPGWLSWGDRAWTLPEALISRRLMCKIGTRRIKEMDIRQIANHAYRDREEAAVLIDGYDGKEPLSLQDRVQLLLKAIWKRAIGSDTQSINESSGSMFTAYQAERVYALMGFLPYRITPNNHESEEGAFLRLMEENGLQNYQFKWYPPTWSMEFIDEMKSDDLSNPQADLEPDHVVAARFDYGGSVRATCESGTRGDALAAIYDWIRSDGKTPRYDDGNANKRIFWIYGLAGCGKSTVAQSVAEFCDENGYLAASFFCSRDIAECSDASRIFPTIAYQISQCSPQYKKQVTKALRADRDLRYARLERQLQKLIVEPLRQVSNLPSNIIIIDALNECSDPQSVSGFLTALDKFIADLPVKFLIASRPDHNISGPFRTLNLRAFTISFDLNSIGRSQMNADIRTFIKHKLAILARAWSMPGRRPWPSDSEIDMLVERAQGLFTFAVTTIKYLEDQNVSDPQEQLKRLLESPTSDGSSSPYRSLDALYLQVFQTAFPAIDDLLKQRLRMVLGILVLCVQPLSASAVEDLANLSRGTVRKTVQHLHSLLIIPENDNEAIRLIHTSIHDFFISRERCIDDRFVIDSASQHAVLARLCLERMTSFTNKDVHAQSYTRNASPDKLRELQGWVSKKADAAITYARRYWSIHLKAADLDDLLITSFNTFLGDKHSVDIFIMKPIQGISILIELFDLFQDRSTRRIITLKGLYKSAVHLCKFYWPFSWEDYENEYSTEIEHMRKFLCKYCSYNDGLYGLLSPYLQVTITMTSSLITYLKVDIKLEFTSDIDGMESLLEKVDKLLAQTNIPEDSKANRRLFRLLSSLQVDISAEIQDIYFLRPMSDGYRDEIRRGLANLTHLLSSFLDDSEMVLRDLGTGIVAENDDKKLQEEFVSDGERKQKRRRTSESSEATSSKRPKAKHPKVTRFSRSRS